MSEEAQPSEEKVREVGDTEAEAAPADRVDDDATKSAFYQGDPGVDASKGEAGEVV